MVPRACRGAQGGVGDSNRWALAVIWRDSGVRDHELQEGQCAHL